MKTVVITGGSRGIGRATVEKFAKDGYNVVFAYKSSDCQANELSNAYGNVVAVKADVSTAEGIDLLFDTAEDIFKTVDVAVFNAGICKFGMLCDMTETDYDEVFALNFKSVFLGTKRAQKTMVAQKSGSIITVSSMWGEVGASCEALYSASKSAVIGFTKAMAKELAPSGIRVNCVSPGVIDSDMNAHLTGDTLSALAEDVPLCRLGSPEEVADAICFLASDKASYITGQILSVNGGLII